MELKEGTEIVLINRAEFSIEVNIITDRNFKIIHQVFTSFYIDTVVF